MSEPTTENPTYLLPSPSDVLKARAPFPFKEKRVWTEGFNHLEFKKGDGGINVNKTLRNGEPFFQITIPENPTLGQIIKITRQFIKEAEISVESYGLSRLLIFCRDLRNSARVLSEMAKSFDDQKQKEALEFINSLYQLGEGLERSVRGEDISITSFESLDDERLKDYELPPQETNLEGYKNNLLLFLLGKNYQSFAEANQQDPKLSQVVEHSTYYYLFNRFIERKIKSGHKIPKTYGEQIEMFDNYLLANKEKLFSHLFPFIPQSLQEGGRAYNAFWEAVNRNIFSLLDQAIEEEGWQKAKEPLKPPLLFTDLGKEVQERLKELGLLNKGLALNFEEYIELLRELLTSDKTPESFPILLFKLGHETIATIEKVKKEAKKQSYGQMSLFEVAQKILEAGQQLPTVEKIKTLWELVQAYEYEKTYLLTSAIEEQAFECNLRSYILGRLFQKLMGNEVEVYTVNPTEHTLLLVVDKSTNKGYWVDPTTRRFYYDKNKRISYLKKPLVNQVNPEEWRLIQQRIKASPDNFHIFGNFTIGDESEFATILPFRQGIEAGFWNNFGGLKLERFEKEEYLLSNKEKIKLIEEAHCCYKKALGLNSNDPGHHSTLAIIYIERELAEAMVREKYGKTEEEELTEDQQNEVDSYYFKNFNYALQHRGKAYKLDPTPDRLDRFLWVIKQIPDDQAQQVFDALTPQTKQLILQMYQSYQDKKPKLQFSFGFKYTQFWQLMKQWIDEQNKNKNQP